MRRKVVIVALLIGTLGCKRDDSMLLERDLTGNWRLKAYLQDDDFNGFDSTDIKTYVDPRKKVIMNIGKDHYLQYYIDGVPAFNFPLYWSVIVPNSQNPNRRIYLRPNYDNTVRIHDVDRLDENGLILYYTWTWRYDPVLQKDIYVRYGHWYVRDN